MTSTFPTRHSSLVTRHYGIDAPYLLPILGILIAANVASGVVSSAVWPFVGAAAVLGSACCGLYTSRRGKFVVWAKLLDQLKWRGDERVLDLGCGRGAVLLLAPEHLTTGRAVGVDIWERGDQWGNSAEATRRNDIPDPFCQFHLAGGGGGAVRKS